MKNRFSPNKFAVAWLIFHAVIGIIFLITLAFYGSFTFDADFNTMMPSTTNKAARIAEDSVAANSGNSVFIIAGNADFQKAKTATETAYNALKDSSKFKSLVLYNGLETLSDVRDFLGKWRWNVLGERTIDEILQSPQGFAENALAAVYSGFSLTPIDTIGEDPFMLDGANFSDCIDAISDSGTALQPKDGVLANELDGVWYVMIRGELSAEGAKLASKENAVPLIYETCFPLETDGTRFAFYGTPFHSHKSSTSATVEVKIISTITMLCIVVMLLVVFRSPVPIVVSVGTIFLSIGISFLATHAIFGQLHVIAIIFGTSLIGSCIDYSLHYFINWKGSPELKTGEHIRKHLMNGLSLSLISTEICYLLMMFAPFTMLKQISVFSFTGIASSFLTVIGIFPLFKIPTVQKRRIPLIEKFAAWRAKESDDTRKRRKFIGKFIIGAMFAFCIVSIVVQRDKIAIKNNIQNLYVPSGRLKDDTILAYRVIQYDPTCWLILSGDSEEEVLQLEESLSSKIPDPYISITRFVPSMKRQKESLAAAEKLIPYTQDQMDALGFEEEDATAVLNDFENAKGKFLTPDDELPSTLKSLVDILWIGKVDGKYYSIMLPSYISDEEAYKQIAAQDSRIYYENKLSDISAGLDRLTKMICIMFAVAFVVIVVLMKFFYSGRDTFKILTIPLISVLSIITTFAYADMKIEFFCITGVLLVFGLGLDYVIYKRQNKGNATETFAITLSFITTAISFGALVFSSFIPVHVLGLSIFSGLVASFVCTML